MNLATMTQGPPDAAVALIDGAVRLSYAELRDRVARTAGALSEAGVGPDDRVLVLAANEVAFVVALLGVWQAGAAAVLLNHQEPAPQLGHYLSDVAPAAILAGTSHQAIGAATELAGMGLADRLLAHPAGTASADLPTADGPPRAAADLPPDAAALLIFTSGVSGLPKPAVLTHGNLAATHSALAARSDIELAGHTVSLGALPMVHILGLNVAVLSTLRHGGTTVLQSHWNAEQAIELIDEHGIDSLVLVPAMWSDLARCDSATPADFAGVGLTRCGAATLTPEIATEVHRSLGIDLATGYGLTETAGTVTYEPNALVRPGSVGTALNHVELRIIDGDVDAEPGDPGEIWIRGDCVFAGFYGHGEADEEVFRDGWLRTGDIGVFDDRLYLVGLKKDMISVSGFKVAPIEVELALESRDEIDRSLVVGEPDERTGERVVAYVVPSSDRHVDVKAAQDHVRASLARYKVPKEIFVVEHLPATILGKRVRRKRI